MRPFVIDANAIHKFQYERVSGEIGEAHKAIEAIFKVDCIALDEQGLCQAEWLACAAGTFPLALKDWISDQLIARKIQLSKLSPNTCWKHLLSLGVPKADHKWIRLAIGCDGKTIVTEDIDFFDPTKKNASSETKEKIKSSRDGRCAKELGKQYLISIMCLRHVPDEFGAEA